jgi:hypothetical protein
MIEFQKNRPFFKSFFLKKENGSKTETELRYDKIFRYRVSNSYILNMESAKNAPIDLTTEIELSHHCGGSFSAYFSKYSSKPILTKSVYL